jgi:hypothetical protein
MICDQNRHFGGGPNKTKQDRFWRTLPVPIDKSRPRLQIPIGVDTGGIVQLLPWEHCEQRVKTCIMGILLQFVHDVPRHVYVSSISLQCFQGANWTLPPVWTEHREVIIRARAELHLQYNRNRGNKIFPSNPPSSLTSRANFDSLKNNPRNYVRLLRLDVHTE